MSWRVSWHTGGEGFDVVHITRARGVGGNSRATRPDHLFPIVHTEIEVCTDAVIFMELSVGGG